MKRGLFIGAMLLFALGIEADQTGDCTAGTQYCEQNSLNTIS